MHTVGSLQASTLLPSLLSLFLSAPAVPSLLPAHPLLARSPAAEQKKRLGSPTGREKSSSSKRAKGSSSSSFGGGGGGGSGSGSVAAVRPEVREKGARGEGGGDRDRDRDKELVRTSSMDDGQGAPPA